MRQAGNFNHTTDQENIREERGAVEKIRNLFKRKKESGSLTNKRQVDADINEAAKEIAELRGSKKITVKEESLTPVKPMTKEEREAFEIKKRKLIEEFNKKRSKENE